MASSLLTFFAFWIGALQGCAAPHTAGPPAVDPAALVAPSAAPGQWMAHQRVTVHVAGAAPRAFEAALQKDADSLVIVGLTPARTRLFTVVQRSADPAALEVETVLEALPFEPLRMVLDVQRVFVQALPGAPLGDGEHRGGEVTELWRGGRLLERRFSSEPPAVVRFGEPGWAPGEAPPARIELESAVGYTLILETLQWSALDATQSTP